MTAGASWKHSTGCEVHPCTCKEPSVGQALADATTVLLADPGNELAASVLWLADKLDQANVALEAALGREDVREARPANTAGTRGGGT